MNLAVIPARGGSKRIKSKNIKLFNGKPIIAYSIETAIKSKLFDKVIVSTDDIKIAEVAKSFGAEVPFMRPTHLSDDHTSTNAVVDHAIRWYLSNGIKIDYTCCIYATAPFIKCEYLESGYQELLKSGYAYVFSVTSFPSPIQRALRINDKGEIEAIWPENINVRSQDLDQAYHDAGQFYWGTAQAFMDDVITFSTKSLPFILPRHLVQDIDTIEDWKRAELMYRSLLMTDNNL